jgi:carbamoyltransferase
MTAEEQARSGVDNLNAVRSELPAVIQGRLRGAYIGRAPGHQSGLSRLALNFREPTGCPVVVNTYFDVRGEPIVCTPEDALRHRAPARG